MQLPALKLDIEIAVILKIDNFDKKKKVMRLQIIEDSNGQNAGVFIPKEDWDLIKSNYPDIDNLEKELPTWQRKLLDERLDAISQNSDRLKPIEDLLQELDCND